MEFTAALGSLDREISWKVTELHDLEGLEGGQKQNRWEENSSTLRTGSKYKGGRE